MCLQRGVPTEDQLCAYHYWADEVGVAADALPEGDQVTIRQYGWDFGIQGCRDELAGAQDVGAVVRVEVSDVYLNK